MLRARLWYRSALCRSVNIAMPQTKHYQRHNLRHHERVVRAAVRGEIEREVSRAAIGTTSPAEEMQQLEPSADNCVVLRRLMSVLETSATSGAADALRAEQKRANDVGLSEEWMAALRRQLTV